MSYSELRRGDVVIFGNETTLWLKYSQGIISLRDFSFLEDSFFQDYNPPITKVGQLSATRKYNLEIK